MEGKCAGERMLSWLPIERKDGGRHTEQKTEKIGKET